MVIGFYNIKGGVGKTSTCVNLAPLFKKVLVIDLDPQGATSYFFDKEAKKRKILNKPLDKIIKSTRYPNIEIIPADTQLLNYRDLEFIDELKNEYPAILIDFPASLNELNKNIADKCDLIVAPALPNILSLRTYNQLIDLNLKNLKILLNRVEQKESHRKIVKAIVKLPKNQYFKTYIPNSEKIENMPFNKEIVTISYPSSVETMAYKKIYNEIIKTFY